MKIVLKILLRYFQCTVPALCRKGQSPVSLVNGFSNRALFCQPALSCTILSYPAILPYPASRRSHGKKLGVQSIVVELTGTTQGIVVKEFEA